MNALKSVMSEFEMFNDRKKKTRLEIRSFLSSHTHRTSRKQQQEWSRWTVE